MLDPHPLPRLGRSAAEPHPSFHCRRSLAVGSTVNISVGGELDIATVAPLDHALRRAWASSDVIVLDLRELEFIDSSGAHLLVDADRRIRRAGGRLIVVRGIAEVNWLLALLGLDLLLELVDRPPAAADASPVTAPERRDRLVL